MKWRALIVGALCLIAAFGVRPCAAQSQSNAGENIYVWVASDGTLLVGANGSARALPNGPLRAALSRAFGSPVFPETYRPDWDLLAHIRPQWPVRAGLMRGRIDPVPLLSLVRSAGDDWLNVIMECDGLPRATCTGAAPQPNRGVAGQVFLAQFSVDDTHTRPISLTCGYGPLGLAEAGAPLLAVLLLPILLTLWMRHRALAAESRGLIYPEMAWFGYGRFLGALTLGAWLVWIPVVQAVGAPAILSFLCGDGWLRSSELYLIPLCAPAVSIVLCYGLSQPVFARLGGLGYSRRDLVRQSAWGQACSLPLLCFLLAGVAALAEHLHVAASWLLAAFVSYVVSTNGAAFSRDAYPILLTGGVLAARVHEMARQAEVDVRRLFVLPAGRAPLGNAFAAQGSTVIITETLLNRLSIREADAVIAHELTHLRLRHPRVLGRCTVVTFVASIVLAIVVQDHTGKPWLGGLAYSAVMVAGLFVYYALARRFEHAADAGAVALTGDPEAAMTGLAKLGAINRMPLEWGRGTARWMTHPTTIHRLREIARRGELPTDRTAAILARMVAGDFGVEDATHYEIPEATSESLIFSPRARAGLIQGMSWSRLLLTIFLAILLVYWERDAPLVHSLPILLVGLVVIYFLRLCVQMGFQSWFDRRLEQALRARPAPDGEPDPPPDALFVTFAPGDVPRVFDHFYDWDIGLIWRDGGKLRYAGERANFALIAGQVRALEVRSDMPDRRWPRTVIWWQSPRRADAFRFRPVTASSWAALARMLAEWQADGKSDSHAALTADVDPPDSSLHPGLMLRTVGRAALPGLLFSAFIGAAIAAFCLKWGGLLWYVPAACALLAAIDTWPLLRARDAPPPAGVSAPPGTAESGTENG
jgi:Zn-dependent protease with chaperone function